MSEEAEDDFTPESGPYCQHWSELGDCDDLCAGCKHRCARHWPECNEVGCECGEFVNPTEYCGQCGAVIEGHHGYCAPFADSEDAT